MGDIQPKKKKIISSLNENSKKEIKSVVVCNKCFGKIAKGKSHPCWKSRSFKQKNLEKIASPRTFEHTKLTSKNDSGRKVRHEKHAMTSKEKECAHLMLSAKNLGEMQNEFNMSNRQIYGIAKLVRRYTKTKSSVEPKIKEKIVAQGHIFYQYFNVDSAMFDVKDIKTGSKIQAKKWFVHTTNLRTFIQYILGQRNSDAAAFKIGIDGGGGSLKICLNILNDDSSCRKKFKDSSVKRLYVIGIVLNVRETYENINTLIKAIKLKESEIKFFFASDMKVSNILAGIQNHASKHPCVWCEGIAPFETPAKSRTLGGIINQVENFNKEGGNLDRSKNFMNCIKKPLLYGPNDMEILDIIPPPELHLMLGIINKIFDSLNKLWGNNFAIKWAQENGIVRSNYQGGTM